MMSVSKEVSNLFLFGFHFHSIIGNKRDLRHEGKHTAFLFYSVTSSEFETWKDGEKSGPL